MTGKDLIRFIKKNHLEDYQVEGVYANLENDMFSSKLNFSSLMCIDECKTLLIIP